MSTDARISTPLGRTDSTAAQARPSCMNPCHNASRWTWSSNVWGMPGFLRRAFVMTNPNPYAVARLRTPPTIRIFADVSTGVDGTRAGDHGPGPVPGPIAGRHVGSPWRRRIAPAHSGGETLMRRMTVIALLAAFAAAACGKAAGPGPAPTTTGTDACAKQNLQLVNAGALTVGTSNPAYPPYFRGAHTDDSPWKSNDPYTGKGFESAVAYAVARQLGFPHDEVRWVESPFNQSYAPGPKNWDLNIQQISYSKKRAEAVDFSDSYYNESEVLVAKKGTPIANAKSISDLKPYKLAAPLGTTSYEIITDVIKPTKEPGGYQSLADTVAAFNAGAVDGIIVDLPTGLYI